MIKPKGTVSLRIKVLIIVAYEILYCIENNSNLSPALLTASNEFNIFHRRPTNTILTIVIFTAKNLQI